MNKKRWGRWSKAIFLLSFIWFYACLTGLSPCVFRSAAMLTLPIIAKSMDRTPNMYNIIAASLLFMLAIDPFLILDVGFQLSYLAVIGLVVLYKPIYDLYITSSWLPDKIWSVLAVSIAAQIATLPITLYVFHQFPNYFLITNLFVVPLSSLIIYIGILLMAFGSWPFIAMIVAKILVFLIWLLNSVIHIIEELPFSTITGIHVSSAEMFILYLMIITGFLFLTLRRIPILFLFLIICIGFMMMRITVGIERLDSSRLLVFNIKQIPLVEFSRQDKSVFFYGNGKPTDGKILFDNFKIAKDDLDAHGIRRYRAYWLGKVCRRTESMDDYIPVFRAGHFFQFGHKKIFILNHPLPKKLDRCIKMDYVIITGNIRTNIAEIVRHFQPGMIILDGSNSRFNIKRWMKESDKEGVSCHAVTISGALEKEF
jgi:competence protein ComEC